MGHAVTGLSQPNYKLEYNNTLIPDELLMNKKLLLTLGVASAIAASYAAKKDPVVMRIAGRDVPRSEFEYLYHKNANQQLEPQSIEQYAEMFTIYKMKVADALAEGLDTTKAFQNEFKGYQVDLRVPYAMDSTYLKQLMHEVYDRSKEEVQAYHIMIAKPNPMAPRFDARAKADSLLAALRNGADFEQLAKDNSQDGGSASQGGYMGWVTAGRLPYSFETAVYTLKPGEISDVVESYVGYHILKGGEHRPLRGEVLVSHILKTVPQGATPETEAKIKAQADSLYNLAIQGADFTQLAMANSEDPGSAKTGGRLPWFGTGQMVQEFDSAAFAIAPGEISRPVKTRFGWHIIKKLEKRGLPSYKDMEKKLEMIVNNPNDERGSYISANFVGQLKKKYKFKENEKLRKKLIDYASANGIDSTFFDAFNADSKNVIMSFADRKFTLDDFMKNLSHYRVIEFPSQAPHTLNRVLDLYTQQEIYRYFFDHLAEENAEYRNLENEYRDGMLLFEISNRKVWEKASRDTEGLDKFFRENSSDYTWSTPHVKGLFVQTASDSVAQAVKSRIAELGKDTVVSTIRKEFPETVKIEKILMAKGDNPMVDALVFGGSPVENNESKYPVYFLENFVVLNAPEEVADVRGKVTSDYQNALERAWIEELKTKYPVEIFENELKKIK